MGQSLLELECKFLSEKNGKVVKRYAPTDTPEKIEKDLSLVL